MPHSAARGGGLQEQDFRREIPLGRVLESEGFGHSEIRVLKMITAGSERNW